jgi:hypothetical protein
VNEQVLTKLKEQLWNALQFFEQHHHNTIAAFLWMDAAQLANLNNSYAEAVGL